MLRSNEITPKLKVYILPELGNMFGGRAMLPGDCCLDWCVCVCVSVCVVTDRWRQK